MSVLIIAKPKNFDLDQIYASGQCFRWEKLEEGYGSDYVIPLYDTVLRATDYEQTKMRIDTVPMDVVGLYGSITSTLLQTISKLKPKYIILTINT